MPTWTDRMRAIARDQAPAVIAAAQKATQMSGFPVTARRVAARCAIGDHSDFQAAAWREALYVAARALSPNRHCRPAGMPLIGL